MKTPAASGAPVASALICLLVALAGFASTPAAAQTPETGPSVTIAWANPKDDPPVEGDDAKFEITATPAPDAPLMVALTVTEKAGIDDYVAATDEGSKTVTVPTSGKVTFAVETQDNNRNGRKGSVEVTLAAGDGYRLGDPSTSVMPIHDDEPTSITVERTIALPVVRNIQHPISEAGGVAQVTVSLSLALYEAGQEVTVPLVISGAVANTHYSLALAPGQTGVSLVTAAPHSAQNPALKLTGARTRKASIRITALENTDEVTRAVKVALGSVSSENLDGGVRASPGDPVTATIGIANNDGKPIVQVRSSHEGYTLSEYLPYERLAYTLYVSPLPTADIVVNLAWRETGQFVEEPIPRTVTLRANNPVPKVFYIALDDDIVDEPHGEIGLEVLAGDGYTVDTLFHRTSNKITDDDGGPTVSLSAGAGITEGGKAVFTLTRGTDGLRYGQRPQDLPPPHLRLQISQTGDFLSDDQLGVKEFQFPGERLADSPLKTTYEVQTLNDSAGEKDGKIIATLLKSPIVERYSTYAVDYAPRNQAQVGVTDDDGGASPGVILKKHPLSLEEGGKAGSYTAELATDPGDSATVTLTVEVPAAERHAVSVQAPGGAAGSSASLTFTGGAQGNWTHPQTITVAPLADEDGANSSIMLTHAVSGYPGVSTAPGVQVAVKDLGYGIRLHQDKVRVAEPIGKASYGVSLMSKPTHEVTVTPASSDATKAGVSGALKFAPSAWDTPQNIEVSGLAVGNPHISHTVASTDSNYNGISGLPQMKVEVVADDRPAVSLAATPNPVPEGTRLTLTARFDTDISLAEDLVIPLVFTEGTAKAADYGAVDSITIKAGKREGEATVVITNDDVLEQPDETFTVAFGTLPAAVQAGAARSVEVAIDDSSDQIFVSLSADPNPAEEAARVKLTATLNSNPRSNQDLVIPLVFTEGTAKAADYGAVDSITIKAGKRKGNTTITIAQDAEYEHPDETFTVAVGELPAGFAASARNASVEIAIDDSGDAPRVATLSVDPATVEEGKPATVTVTLDKAFDSPARDTRVTLVPAPGTANADDYKAPASVLIASGKTTGAVKVETVDDGEYEHPDETFTVALPNTLPEGLTAGDPASVAIAIDDGAQKTPSVHFDTANVVVSEGSNPVKIARIVKTEDHDADISVPIQVRAGGAVYETDYRYAFPYRGEVGEVSVGDRQAGRNGGTIRKRETGIDLGAEILDNDTDDPLPATPRAFSVRIFNLPNGIDLGAPSTVTVRIEDDEPTLVTLTPGADLTITEGDATTTAAATLSLARALAAGEVAEVPLLLASSTGAPLPGSDNAGLSLGATGTGVTLAGADTASPKVKFSGAGAQSAALTFTATANPDSDGDNDTVQLRLGDLAAVSLATNLEGGAEAEVDNDPNTDDNLVEITVVDALKGYTFSIEADAATVDEGEQAGFTISAHAAPPEKVKLTLDVAETGGRLIDKQRNLGERSFTFPADETSAKLTLKTKENGDDEADEGALTVTIKEVDHYSVAADAGSASVVVADDDPTEVTLAGADTSFTEGDTGTTAKVTLTLARELKPGETAEIPLRIASATGAALPGSESPDFTLSVSGANATLSGANSASPGVTFAKKAAGTGKTQTAELIFTAASRDDGDFEDDTIEVRLGDLAAAGLATNLEGGVTASDDGKPGTVDNQARLTLEDDDRYFTLSVDPATVGESAGATDVVVTATASNGSGFNNRHDITVSVGAAGDSAALGDDYQAVADFTIRVGSNKASKTGRFKLTPVDDAIHEATETISVAGALTRLKVVPASIALTDGDPAPTVTLALAQPRIEESGADNSTAVTASIDGLSSADITLTVSASPVNPATSGDFTLSENTKLTIPAGKRKSTGAVTITAVDNQVTGPDKTVTVSAAASGGHGIASPASRTLTILDDTEGAQQLVTFETATAKVREGKTVKVTAVLDQPASENLNIPLSYTLGTAEADDFEEETRIHIPRGKSEGSRWVQIVRDATRESPAETFTISFGALPQGFRAGARDSVVVTIDDEPIVVSLVSSTATTRQEQSPGATVYVALNNPYHEALTVPLTYDFGAAEASDLGEAPASITVPADSYGGLNNASATISFVNDDIYEGPETFTVSLGDLPKGTDFMVKGNSRSVEYTIADDADLPVFGYKNSGPEDVVEGAASLALTREGKTELAAEIHYQVVGNPEDILGSRPSYQGSVSLAPGDGLIVKLPVIDDREDEQPEQLQFSLIEISGGRIAQTARATKVLTIIDDDPTPVTLAPGGDVSLDESDSASTASVILTLARDLVAGETAEIPLVLSSATGAALPGSANPDFTLAASGNHVSLSGATSASPRVKFAKVAGGGPARTATLTFTATGRDDGDSQDESIEVGLGDLDAAGLATNLDGGVSANDDGNDMTVDNRVSIALVDDEDGPDGFELSVDTASVAENIQTAPTITVTASIKGTGTFTNNHDITVSVGAGGDTASSADYAAVTDFTIRVPAGQTSATGSFVLDPTDDTIDEAAETLSVTGDAGPIDVDPAVITITDDDPLPTVTLALTPSAINEKGAPNASTVSASLDRASGATITLTVAATPEAPAKAEHFVLSKNTELTIAAGARTSTGAVTITAVDDDKEGGKTIDVSAAASGGYGVADPASVALTIKDDEAPDGRPTVDLSIADADGKLAEGASTDVTVTLTGGTLNADVTIPVTVSGAQAGDYSWGGNIVIAAGETSNKASLSLTDDALDEPTETLTLALGALPATVREGTATSVTLAIIDGDATSVTLARATGETGAIAENRGVATLTVTLDRALVSGESVSAPLAVSGAGITAGDYEIRLKAGQNLNSGVGLDTTTPNTAAAPAVVFTGAGSDPATSTVSTATLELVAQSDDIDEGASETLAVALGSVTSNLDRATGTGTGGATASGTVSVAITDDDSRGVAVSAETLDIDETDTASTQDDEEHKGTYTVVLESRPTGAVTIDIEAPEGAPFSVSPATLTFAPDEWDDAQTVTVTAKNDDLDNAGDERVATITHAVKASGADYADETAASVEVTVADDDTAGLTFSPAA
ncbi:MAG: hypothetical protein OXG59_07330, partial [Gammaproteobacteria bacterium]|nr:hypothetical protein [Gammaproteobacteria bacterium]